MNAMFSAKDAMDQRDSYKSLMAEKEHLDAAISEMLDKIQSYREGTTEWSEIDKINTRISEMNEVLTQLKDTKNPEDIPHDTVLSIQNSIETAREYRGIVIRDLERKVSFLGENNYLNQYRNDLVRVKKVLWNNFGIDVN